MCLSGAQISAHQTQSGRSENTVPGPSQPRVPRAMHPSRYGALPIQVAIWYSRCMKHFLRSRNKAIHCNGSLACFCQTVFCDAPLFQERDRARANRLAIRGMKVPT
eukprot:6474418-Amphidinium_carterae.1